MIILTASVQDLWQCVWFLVEKVGQYAEGDRGRRESPDSEVGRC